MDTGGCLDVGQKRREALYNGPRKQAIAQIFKHGPVYD